MTSSEETFQLRSMLLVMFLFRADMAQSYGLAIRDGMFAVVWMATVHGQVLVRVGGFADNRQQTRPLCIN